MPAEVKILIEGCTNADSVAEIGGEKTRPTITLIRDGDLVMVVDPGVLESQQILIDALAKEGLRVEDVNMVCITHSHLDHYANIGMFPNAKALDFWGIWDRGAVDVWPENFTANIQILHTPGHDYTGITLFVTIEAGRKHPGVVAICGDVFWRENFPRDPKDDAYASNPEKLIESRRTVLNLADWVIPGHGPRYRVIKGVELEEERHEKIHPQIVIKCKKCHREMTQEDKCQCRPHLCFRCCECGMDCDLCSCSHKK